MSPWTLGLKRKRNLEKRGLPSSSVMRGEEKGKYFKYFSAEKQQKEEADIFRILISSIRQDGSDTQEVGL